MRRAPIPILPPHPVECCNEECGWAGCATDCKWLGGVAPIGPLCPECGEVTERALCPTPPGLVERALVQRIVAAGRALVEEDPGEAYHQLYEALRDAGYDDLPDGTFNSAVRALVEESKP